MKYVITIIFFLTSVVIYSNSITNNDPDKIKKQLAQTWYSHNIGKEDGSEMRPSKRKEVWTYNTDGSMIFKELKMGMEFKGTWEYLSASKKLKLTLDINGNEEAGEFPIISISDSSMVLSYPEQQFAVEYKTTPPDPNRKIREAPFYTNSVSTIDFENWTGLHPFNQKVITSSDGNTTKLASVGVIVLLQSNGKRILRVNDDGLTTDIETGDPAEIDGEIHYQLMTDEVEFAGKLVFRNDKSFYLFNDKDQSTTEYIKEEE